MAEGSVLEDGTTQVQFKKSKNYPLILERTTLTTL